MCACVYEKQHSKSDMKWRMSVYEGIHVKCIKATTVLGLLYKRVYKKWSFSTDSKFVSKFAVLQRCEGAKQMAEDVSRKELQRILHCVSQNPWNPTPACWFRICTPSLPSLRIAMHHCQAVLTRPTWLRVGSEPRQTDCWKANLLPSGTSQAPSYSCSRLPSPFCCRVFGGFWRWNWDAPKTKAGHYLQDLSIWKMHNCRLMHKPAYRWSLTEMSKLFSLIGLKAI